MAKYSKYFTSSPDWERYCNHPSRSELALKSEPSKPTSIDIGADRAVQDVEEGKWAAVHPPESYGYVTREEEVTMRDGHQIGVKIYHPKDHVAEKKLPLLFVTHGGGGRRGRMSQRRCGCCIRS